MGGVHTKIRRHGKVYDLPQDIKAEVDRFLVEGATYEEISEYLKKKGYDISKSAIGRYGKEFFNFYRTVKIVEEKSRALVSEAGDGLTLIEACEKIFTKQIIELLLANEVDVRKIPRLISDFARLQQSSVLREKVKAELKKKLKKILDSAEQKPMSQKELLRFIKEKVYGL